MWDNFKVLHSPTTANPGPYTLSKVPVSLKRKTVRKSFACPFKALEALRSLKLKRSEWYGADVCDANGVKLGEVGE